MREGPWGQTKLLTTRSDVANVWNGASGRALVRADIVGKLDSRAEDRTVFARACRGTRQPSSKGAMQRVGTGPAKSPSQRPEETTGG